ncbi:MAG TPA: alcohol dehydrogenase catalytic domain-containing protein, partial [Candidatus Acidoferrales bacterium]|nr:alcohol dehydrogenase catalytic domain-containing protein [Candidatus Acidoferrales bacterium]
LVLEERARPNPANDEILIRTKACGVCHGDLMAQAGAFPFVNFPIVLGHEITGIVEAVGAEVSSWRKGDRVGLSALFSTCGKCRHCASGNENLCPGWVWTGVMKDGGYQEYLCAKANYAVRIPDVLDFAEAAPLLCAGVTVYSGLVHGGFAAGKKVAVIGTGGLGNLGVLLARAMGGRIAIISTNPQKKQEADELGAELFIDTTQKSTGEALQQWDGGADLVLATAPSVESVNQAFGGLAPDGTMVVLGVGPGSIEVNPIELVMGRRRVLGSPAGSLKELRECMGLAAKHGIRPKIRKRPLEAAGEALQEMCAGHMNGRAVLVMN